MKKELIGTMVAITLCMSGFAAKTDKRFLRAENSLRLEFKKAENVEWSSKQGMMKASFLDQGIKTEAFFGSVGQLLATCKSLGVEQIPLEAKIKLAQKYPGFIITEAIAYQDEDGLAYYVSAESNVQKVIIKSQDGITSLFQKTNR
jgi:hypothetical protein